MCRSQFGMHMKLCPGLSLPRLHPEGSVPARITPKPSRAQLEAWWLFRSPCVTVTGIPRINFDILIIGSSETALGLWREARLPKNYLEPECHCFRVGTGQFPALHELLDAFESSSFHQTAQSFKDRCLRGHFEGKWSFSLLRNQFYSPSRKPLNFITKKKSDLE